MQHERIIKFGLPKNVCRRVRQRDRGREVPRELGRQSSISPNSSAISVEN